MRDICDLLRVERLPNSPFVSDIPTSALFPLLVFFERLGAFSPPVAAAPAPPVPTADLRFCFELGVMGMIDGVSGSILLRNSISLVPQLATPP